MKTLKFALAGLLFATPAFAQEEGAPAEGAPTEGTGETPADPNAAAGGETMAAPADTGSSVMWPRSAIDRPYFRGKGKITVGGDFNLLAVSFTDPLSGMSSTSTVDFITLGAAYGVTDQISVGLNYAVSLGLGDGDFEVVGPLALWGGYQIKHDAKMSLGATGAFAVNLDDTDQMGIALGLGARYMVAPKIGVFTGAPYGPGPVGGVGLGGGPLGNLFGPGGHLNISLSDGGPITFDLPVGAMFQATPELAIHASTSLASIALSNSPYVNDMGEEKAAVLFGADLIPLVIGGLYSASDKLDVLINLNLPDLKEAQFDLYVISAGARFHM